MINEIRFIDLFAGIGGLRLGLTQACEELNIKTNCVFTSEIKPSAIKVYQQNFPNNIITGDITKVDEHSIPDFDILLAGFPCQAFSYAGNQDGFGDTRGTLFFDVLRILNAKQPKGFILENVEGLVSHNKGKTFQTIISNLQENYNVAYKILNAKDFGIPQNRKRIYIVGALKNYNTPQLNNFQYSYKTIQDIMEKNIPCNCTPFIKNLLSHYNLSQLEGKKITDKRGGDNNIHSWDIELKGPVSKQQKQLLNLILKNRRHHKWAKDFNIDWMDGMPLTFNQIQSFYNHPNLQTMLDDLTQKGYLTFQYPKKKITITTHNNHTISRRIPDETKPKGYNITTGKLSFEISEILAKNSIAPTLVATDMNKLHIIDNNTIRQLSTKEGLRLFGYPDDFIINTTNKNTSNLLGNTVVVPVIKQVALKLLTTLII